ncbi:MAG: hypothetical protein ACREIC_28725, partial [Limisphaerales bacterium]
MIATSQQPAASVRRALFIFSGARTLVRSNVQWLSTRASRGRPGIWMLLRTKVRAPLRAARRRCELSLLGALLLAISTLGATAPSAPTAPPERPTPITPREFFNAGTEQLRAGKLREAEAYFENALGSQAARLQPPALYNLGHVRFGQGIEELKKGPAAGPTNEHG